MCLCFAAAVSVGDIKTAILCEYACGPRNAVAFCFLASCCYEIDAREVERCGCVYIASTFNLHIANC